MPASPKLRPMLPRYHSAPRSRAHTQRRIIMLLALILFISSGSMLVFRMLTRPFTGSSGKDCANDADYTVIQWDREHNVPYYDNNQKDSSDPFVKHDRPRVALPHQVEPDYDEVERQQQQQSHQEEQQLPSLQNQQEEEQQPPVALGDSNVVLDEEGEGDESVDLDQKDENGGAAEPELEPFERTLPANSNEKYLTYLPYAGITNQFYGMLRGMYLARTLGRTLIIPPITASSHDKSKQNQPWSKFLDLERFQKATGIKVVEVHELRDAELAQFNEIKCGITCGFGSKRTIDFTAKGFLKQWKLKETLYPLKEDVTKLDAITANLRPYQDDQFVCISNTYKILVKDRDEWEQFGQHLYFTKPLEEFVQKYLQENLGSLDESSFDYAQSGGELSLPKYIAIHIRRGDFAEYCTKAFPGDKLVHCLPSTEQIAERVASLQEKYGRLYPGKVLPVLVATNEQRPEELKKFADNGWKYLDHEEMGTSEQLGVFGPMMVDQVFMAHAENLIGIRQSTFSRVGALRQRDWHHRQMEYM